MNKGFVSYKNRINIFIAGIKVFISNNKANSSTKDAWTVVWDVDKEAGQKRKRKYPNKR